MRASKPHVLHYVYQLQCSLHCTAAVQLAGQIDVKQTVTVSLQVVELQRRVQDTPYAANLQVGGAYVTPALVTMGSIRLVACHSSSGIGTGFAPWAKQRCLKYR